MSRLRTRSTAVGWAPWTAGAFARAREERKPVLLSITTEWCGWCREMDRSSFADPSAAATINERFVPVRVDADARPDIAERYGLGGWPTTAFLSASGDLLGGGTFFPPARLNQALARVLDADAWAISSAIDRAAPPAAVDRPPDADALARAVFASFDSVHGGVGGAPKFPHTAPVRLALDGLGNGRPTAEEEALAVHALDAMGWRGLFDEEHGGFFHYAATEDWTTPHTAKRLDANADLIRLYLTAGTVLAQSRYTGRAADALRYVQTWLADPVDGGWYAAQHAGDDFYASDPATRTSMPPPVGRRMYADGVAAMASAALHAADVFDDEGLRQFALTSLERVLLACYKPGDGVAHYHDGHRRCRGLLADQVAMASACLDAHDASGNVVYSMMAEELMHFAVRTLWDGARGGFLDRPALDGDDPDAVGLLRVRLRPFVENCTAAGVLARIAAVSGDHDFSRYAADTLAAMAPLARAQGPLAAHYLLALRGP